MSACTGGEPEEAEETPVSTAPHMFSDEILGEQLRLFLMGMAYDRETAGEISASLVAWKDDEGNPMIGTLEAALFNAKAGYQEGNLAADELIDREVWITLGLGRKIKGEIPEYNVENWDLHDVITTQSANCVGYTQLFYTLGSAIGLDVIPIEVLASRDLRDGHVTALVNLTGGQVVMVELTSDTAYMSEPFVLSDEFTRSGGYWEVPNRAASKFPHSRIRLLDEDGMMAALFISRAANLNAQGEPERALAEYIVAIELDPKYALAYNNRGATLQRLGYASDALTDFNMAIVLDPYHAESYSNRGVAYIDTGRYTEALSDFDRALELGGGGALLYYNRGLARYYQKDYTAALSDLDRAIELDPSYSKAYYQRAGVYYDLKDYEKALADYGAAIEADPMFAEAYNGRGAVHSSMKDYTAAIKDYDTAIALGIDSYATYFNRGNAHYNKGEYTKALDDYTMAIRLKPDLAEAYKLRGYTYKKLGDDESAKIDFDNAAFLDPTFKP